jgi:hypothetical protein
MPDEMRAAAATVWETTGRDVDHLITVLRDHRASGTCPGPWCPGTTFESHLGGADRFELEAWVHIAIFRLVERKALS